MGKKANRSYKENSVKLPKSALGYLENRVLESIERSEDDKYLIFNLTNGRRFKMYHEQDCCERVYLAEVIGDLDDLVGEKLVKVDISRSDEGQYRWTFYRFATIKGSVTLRWCADTDTYYSIEVDFKEII